MNTSPFNTPPIAPALALTHPPLPPPRDGSRVIYTSPLKALSNQKYRELKEAFGDVGLMTGDVTIDPNASCLVMTTEILRSMLYRGSGGRTEGGPGVGDGLGLGQVGGWQTGGAQVLGVQGQVVCVEAGLHARFPHLSLPPPYSPTRTEVVREVGLLVYDEVHYLRDAERGVVWEESIVLAPRGARMAFLSATLPNAAEFAGWVAGAHGSPCHVVYTDYRPTPLQHFVFPAGGAPAGCVCVCVCGAGVGPAGRRRAGTLGMFGGWERGEARGSRVQGVARGAARACQQRHADPCPKVLAPRCCPPPPPPQAATACSWWWTRGGCSATTTSSRQGGGWGDDRGDGGIWVCVCVGGRPPSVALCDCVCEWGEGGSGRTCAGARYPRWRVVGCCVRWGWLGLAWRPAG